MHPYSINGSEVEKVSYFRFLGVNISNDLTWSVHKDKVVKAARKHLFFLRRLKKFGMDSSSSLTSTDAHREHSDWLHPSVVWELHRQGPQGPM